MALKLSTTIKGVTQEFYVKVVNVRTENKGNAVANYGYFSKSELATDIKNSVESLNVPFTSIADQDIFEQAYIILKNKDEFTKAVDC